MKEARCKTMVEGDEGSGNWRLNLKQGSVRRSFVATIIQGEKT